MITLCKTCGTAYDEQPKNCPICDDERQYVPVTGQAWTDFDSLTTTHTNKWQQLEPQLFSIKTVPAFAINQRALLLRTPQGNVLWDCIANLDPATRVLVDALGGISAIAIRTRITTPPCRSGPPRLTRRSTCTPAIGSG